MALKTLHKPPSNKAPSVARTIKPRISHPDRIKEIAGCMSDADANELRAIIDTSCEKIDKDAW